MLKEPSGENGVETTKGNNDPKSKSDVALVQPQEPKPFSGGEIEFFQDRVELCGVDICSGKRSRTRRKILNLLARKQKEGGFVAYGLEQLTELVKPKGGGGTIAGAIRDLRSDIVNSLRSQANIVCGRRDVILSGGAGYRFAECLSVQWADQKGTKDITDIDDSEDVPNVPNDDVRDAASAARRDWIRKQLAAKVQLKAPMVAKHFRCSTRTARRDLTALKEEGTIEYVGTPRTGYYRLCQRPEADQ